MTTTRRAAALLLLTPLLLAACGRSHLSHEALELQGRSDALAEVVEAQGQETGRLIQQGRQVDADRVYRLGNIRYELFRARLAARVGHVDDEGLTVSDETLRKVTAELGKLNASAAAPSEGGSSGASLEAPMSP